MSYDISLVADLGGEEPVRVGDLDWNYTYNIRPMTERAGLPSLSALDGKPAMEAASMVAETIHKMESDPDGYRALTPTNGWGDFNGFLRALHELHEAFMAAPAAIVSVR